MSNCPKCGGERLAERDADRRTFFICVDCGEFTYPPKKTSAGFEMVVDEIAEGVASSRYHETPTVILINTAFRAESGRDSHSQMKEWAAKHLIRFAQRGNVTVFERDGISLGQLMRGQ